MYHDDLRHAILHSKWSFSTVGIESLAELLASERLTDLSALNADRIIPVPQSWQGRICRPFNSASQVADVLSSHLGIPVDEHILRRRRNSRPQKRVAVNRRFENQRDAFRIQDAHVIRNQRILLVDDVLTTGATCSEAARMLKQHGAATCSVAVIARVLDNSA